jgi:DNA-binding NtrC family response regulator
MMSKTLLILTQDPSGAKSLSQLLEQNGHHAVVVQSNPELINALRDAGYEIAIASLSASGVEEALPSLEQIERQHIERVLEQTRFNLSRASRILAIDRTTLYNKLRRFGLQRDSIRARRLEIQSAAGSNGHQATMTA